MASIKDQIDQQYDAKRLAKIYVDHTTSKEGEVLARVWETPAFQAVFDQYGANKRRGFLKRKTEQVSR